MPNQDLLIYLINNKFKYHIIASDNKINLLEVYEDMEEYCNILNSCGLALYVKEEKVNPALTTSIIKLAVRPSMKLFLTIFSIM